jgi:hypothetical protein
MAVTSTAMTVESEASRLNTSTVMAAGVAYLHDLHPHPPLTLSVIPATAGIQ